MGTSLQQGELELVELGDAFALVHTVFLFRHRMNLVLEPVRHIGGALDIAGDHFVGPFTLECFEYGFAKAYSAGRVVFAQVGGDA